MKKTMFIALSLLSSVAMAETKFNFSGDAYVKGYFKNKFSPDKERGFNQLFRLNSEARVDEKLTIKTGLVLSSEAWEGDKHVTTTTGTAVGGTNEEVAGNGNITHLDHAIIEYNLANGWITSFGRHKVTSPGSFLTSDDRRDRIQVLRISPTYDVLALIYDKRSEGALTNSRDDMDMYSVNYYGTWGDFKYALQTGWWTLKKYNYTNNTVNNGMVNLDNVKQFTPQLSTKVMGIDLDFYYTLLFGGAALYKDSHHAVALKLSKDLEMVKVEYQSMLTKDGGLVASGFDSLSSIINNSPDHNASGIKLRTVGFGLGTKNLDEYLHMVRFSKAVMSDLTLSLSAGVAKLYASTTAKAEKNTVLDATAKYDFSKSLALNAKYGKFFGDNKDHAGSLSLNANF